MNITVIPARGGSKSIPRKNIINVAEKPLIAWSIEQARKSRLVDRVFVTTDDARIAAVSGKYGAEVIRRPKELATDTASSEAALIHALSVIERDVSVDRAVFLQATSPLREKDDIDNALECFDRNGADSLFSCTKMEDYFIWEKRGNGYASVNYDFRNRKRRQDIKPQYLENGSIYIFKPGILRKYGNRLGGKIAVYEMAFWKSFQIDEPEDIGICEYYLRRKILKRGR